MATTTIPWGDGSGDNIYLTYSASQGDQTVLVSSDANGGAARQKVITFVSTVGNISRSLTVLQESSMDYVSITWNDVCITYDDTAIAYPYVEQYIVFADPVVEQICATKWGDGTGIKPSQAAQVANGQLEYTFRNNTDIVSFEESVYFTGITALYNTAFRGCSLLEHAVDFPNCHTWPQMCFQGCTSIEQLVVPSHITILGTYCFNNCTGLLTVTIPDTVVDLGTYCFQNCTGLTSASVMCASISNSSFRDCTSLNSVIIGPSCTSIADNAFLNAGTTSNKCTFIIYATTPPSLANSRDCFTAARINKMYVPNGTLSAYQTATNWSSYSSYMAELNPDGTIPT